MELYGRGIVAGEGGRQNPSTGLEESMWRLGLGGDGSGNLLYPERPGEPDCAFYLRTGTCGYGERCRYNHPRDRGGVFPGAGRPGVAEYPERVGQPVCEYYMKTGTCKFGSTCKYHHPREGVGSVMPAMLNFYGYPLRPGEKECSYYMKTAQCKFGSSCKFHHPQLDDASVPSHAAPTYPVMQTSSVPSAHQIPPLASWQVGRPPMLPGSYMSSSYGPMLLSPGVVPVQGWSPYPAPISPLVSPGGQTVQPGPAYGLSHQMPPSVPAYAGSYVPVSSSARPSNSRQRDYMFPERPGQPECQFYMRTGDCRFGSTCKYHHPPDRNIPKSNCVLSPLGLPLRPGAQPCTYYAQNGVCKFGPTCKFDHPMSTLSYSPSASSLSDLPVAPHRFSIATMAPSSLSSEQRSEFFPVESFAARITSSENTSSSIGSIFSKGGFVPHPLIHPQVSTTSGSSSTRHGGEISSSI